MRGRINLKETVHTGLNNILLLIFNTVRLQDDPPIFREDEEDVIITFNIAEAWNNSDFLCHNYILNGLSEELYEVYNIKKIDKELWEPLDHKYKTEDAGAKKFLVAKFLNFVMVDSKVVVNQVQEFQLIIHGIITEGMIISESFQVVAIIENLPLTWNGFKNYLKHKRKEMTVQDLIVKLRIDEDNRDWVRTNKANAMENISKEVSDLDIYVVIFEVNLVDSNPIEWWLDIGATRHIFCDNDSFVELVPCEKGEKLYMGNAACNSSFS
ncbi:hypothetical protein CXB51_028404 [Gossypium anomalum]|uniref:Uncharacterized protein n=1 Tax=Gossypium anomalum TaxID=47600 RepID=A0A8J6CSQ9_9ROSI|nr:hypothetical protein CXB51_028404 [Gossypium anomalum]